jgi:hypothetical protein
MYGPSIFAADQADPGGVLVVLSHKSLFLRELLSKLKPCVIIKAKIIQPRNPIQRFARTSLAGDIVARDGQPMLQTRRSATSPAANAQ